MLDKARLARAVKDVLEADENVMLGYLFGSSAGGHLTPLSDVDVAILMRDASLREFSELWSSLAKALGVSEDSVDLIDLSSAPTQLMLAVLRKGMKLLDRGNHEEELRTKLIEVLPDFMQLQESIYKEGLKGLDCDLDKGLLKSRAYEIAERAVALKEDILSKQREEVVASRLYRSSMERCTHVIIEAMLDVCRHVVSSKKLGMPETYKETVELVAQAGVMPRDLAQKLESLVGLRNILIHRYTVIDFGRLYEEAEALTSTADSFLKTLDVLIERDR